MAERGQEEAVDNADIVRNWMGEAVEKVEIQEALQIVDILSGFGRHEAKNPIVVVKEMSGIGGEINDVGGLSQRFMHIRVDRTLQMLLVVAFVVKDIRSRIIQQVWISFHRCKFLLQSQLFSIGLLLIHPLRLRVFIQKGVYKGRNVWRCQLVIEQMPL